ncbi:SDR family NAD(P)-dependent oxidoreductase [Rhizorhabdus dicambivorans]|uniref:Short-chain dehydrogenase n=1 Tax=Rhizorhabdus dicambivorans TaxID=1850238 RepID=A0A2A4FV11_9SPHN|nr:SDR family NAD(P)-dependent oxidoreductase [Rhizorhabdus dicambivorans]ATE63908.1 short-chain dehydrogenase [Rhizorhabdus dicambivorans]PCE41512.1 short-chain dehydrogenase [Rhizorhabdus dicambivorans]
MDLGLAGKRALVTGSSSGIGAGIARMLAAEGCVVVVHGRDRDRAEAVARTIGQAGGAADLAIGDLADPAQAEAVARAAGTVDILVNNAGGAAGTSAMGWTEVPDEGWFETYNGNVLAAARMIRALLPAMKGRGWGRVINIASAAATQPIAFGPDYGAAKAAMINMSVSLAKALGACGVTANTVSPGMVLTPAVERWLEGMRGPMGWEGLDMAEMERRAAAHLTPIPVGRIGRVEDIGHAVCMLASPASGYMTGANIRVDGGQVQSIN